MNKSENLEVIRTAAYLTFIIYGIFGVLDYFMLPVNFRIAWILRYLILFPIALLSLGFSYHRKAEKYIPAMIFLLLFSGQSGILAMIVIASPEEPAFYGYYVGLILMILACEFIFRLPLRATFFFFMITEVSYIIIAVFEQNLLNKTYFPTGQSWFIGNLFFMTFAGLISMMGTDRIHRENLNSMKSKNEAQQANKMKSSFLANISHEIRTPLNGIIGYSKLVAEKNISDENRTAYTEIIDYSSNQLIDIVDSIIYMAEIETGQVVLQKHNFEVPKFLAEIISEFALPADKKQLKLELKCPSKKEALHIYTDAQKLRIILNNLISNALKFTLEGSISVEYSSDDGFAVFKVADTGIGIPPEFHETIFEPFLQIDSGYERKFGGNGLGLSLCRSYVSMLGGTIEIESLPGSGTVFKVMLPIQH